MLKALAWKEYREQRQIALIGLLASAMLPVLFIAVGYSIVGSGFSFYPRDLVQMSAFTGALLVWPIFAAVAGSATNPREARVASLGFLLSRPVSRRKVWAVKVGIGFATLATVIGGSIVIFWAILRLVWGPGILLQSSSLDLADVSFLTGFLGLAFACSVFYATLTDSSLVAAGAGLASSFGIHGFVGGFWTLVGLRGDLEWVSMMEIFLVTLLVLAGGRYAFTRGELMRGRRLRRLALVEAVIALAVLVAVSSTFAFALTRVNLSNAIFTNPDLSPAGDLVAVGANRENLSGEQIWLIDLEGNARQLTGRGSMTVAFSPDGEWIAYSRLSAYFGYPPMRLELRVARVDGSDDRRLGRSVGGHPVFSPDGTRVAASHWNDLTIARLDREEIDVVELPGRFEARDIAWSPEGEELLLIAPDQTIAFYHLESGDLRLFEPPEDWPIWFSYPLPADHAVPARMPVSGYWRVPTDDRDARQRYRREYGIGLIDRETLEAEILVRATCPTVAMDLSADELFLAYSTCDERDSTKPQRTRRGSVVHLRNLDSGEDRPLTTLRGSIGNLKFNPSGGSIVVSSLAGPLVIRIGEGHLPTVLDLREEDPGRGGSWLPVGWLDDSRLMLARRPSRSRYGSVGQLSSVSSVISMPPLIEVGSLAVLDIETGDLRTVFSR